MNLFILDDDLDRNAEYHVDDHVGKMQLEAAQLMATALWIDREFGYVPHRLSSDQLLHLRAVTKAEPPIEQRTFLRYLPTHPNHPCAVWVRTSLDNWIWTHCYVNALNSESIWRGNKPHASCAEVNKLPLPKNIPCDGLTSHALAMPEEYKRENAVDAYRAYYNGEKTHLARWKRRGIPSWWESSDPHQQYEVSCKRDEEVLGRNFR